MKRQRGQGNGNNLTGNKLAAVIKKAMRIESVLDKFEREHKNREIIRALAGDPAFSAKDFASEQSLAKVAKRVKMLLGDYIKEHNIEVDPELESHKMVFKTGKNGQEFLTCIDKEIFKAPKFFEIRELLEQLAVIGESPYVLREGESEEKTIPRCPTS